MCSKFSPATVGTNRLRRSVLWVRLQTPLSPARCLSAAELSPMVAVKSPTLNVSWAIDFPSLEIPDGNGAVAGHRDHLLKGCAGVHGIGAAGRVLRLILYPQRGAC